MNGEQTFIGFIYATLGPAIIAIVGSMVLVARTRESGPLGRFIVLSVGLILTVIAEALHVYIMIELWANQMESAATAYILPGVFGLGAVFVTWVIHRAVERSNIGRK